MGKLESQTFYAPVIDQSAREHFAKRTPAANSTDGSKHAIGTKGHVSCRSRRCQVIILMSGSCSTNANRWRCRSVLNPQIYISFERRTSRSVFLPTVRFSSCRLSAAVLIPFPSTNLFRISDTEWRRFVSCLCGRWTIERCKLDFLRQVCLISSFYANSGVKLAFVMFSQVLVHAVDAFDQFASCVVGRWRDDASDPLVRSIFILFMELCYAQVWITKISTFQQLLCKGICRRYANQCVSWLTTWAQSFRTIFKCLFPQEVLSVH